MDHKVGLSLGSQGWIITWINKGWIIARIIRLDYHMDHKVGLSHESQDCIAYFIERLDYQMDH